MSGKPKTVGVLRRTGGAAALALTVLLAGCTSTQGVQTQEAGSSTQDLQTSVAGSSAGEQVSGPTPEAAADGSTGSNPSVPALSGTAAGTSAQPTSPGTQSPTEPTADGASVGPSTSGTTDSALSVPAPTPGNIDETVDAGSEVINPAVSVQTPGDLGNGVTVRVAEVQSTDVTARLPGEVGGNVVSVTLELTNGSGQQIPLNAVTVNLTDAAGNAASTITTEPARPFAGTLQPAQQASAVFLFDVPSDARTDMSIMVSYAAGTPAAVFTGASSA